MEAAIEQAQDTFKYFWRELSWEYRRIVPALDLAIVKAAFIEETDDPEDPIVEYMWLNNIHFDGERVYGVLMNEPHELTNIAQGADVEIPFEEVMDWLLVSGDEVCGGFTVHYFRAKMTDEERQEHDAAWGLNFGDYNDIAVVLGQKEHPENLIEHPMSINMRESLKQHLQGEHRQAMLTRDEEGYSMLHREAIAGNKTMLEVLLSEGADPNLKNHEGKTALDFATQFGWDHIIPVLS